MDSAYLAYAVTEFFLIIFTLSIRMKLNTSVGSEYEVRKLKSIIYTFWVVLVTDIFWELNKGNYISPGKLLNAAVNGISLAAVVLGCFLWFQFVELRLHTKNLSQKKALLLAIPFVLTAVLDLISIFTGWVFHINDSGDYTYGKLFVLQVLGCYFYLLIPTVKALMRTFTTRSRTHRAEYLIYASYMLPSLIAGFLEDAVPTVPVLYLCMFMVIHTLFLTIQDLQIYHDAPTGLYNRRRLNDYMVERLESVSDKEPLVLFLIDIDKFKHINDSFGHVEGDCAITTVAKALSMAAGKFGGFAARYGGDEFCFIPESSSVHQSEITEFIRNALKELRKGTDNYSLEVSIGCCRCDTPDTTPEKIIAIADEQLYIDKKRPK